MELVTERQAEALFREILPEIKPTEGEIFDMTMKVNLLMSRMKEIVPKSVELRVTGSISKGTNLKGNADIDLFLLFPQGTSKESLTKDGMKYAQKLASGQGDSFEIKYAEHPYTRVFLKNIGVRADIVPALKIDNIESMATAVDRTPMHTAFINQNLTDKQRDEVRLLKFLLKANFIYGAEAKTSGFSGYLCELLIYQFGSLIKLLDNASYFKSPVILGPQKAKYSNDRKIAEHFNHDFVVLDPVDHKRNVAAGVSSESLSSFICLARSFTANPRIGAFYPVQFTPKNVKTRGSSLLKTLNLDTYLLVTPVPDKTEDVIWPQLRKDSEILVQYLERFGFEVYTTMQWVQKRKGMILILAPKQDRTIRLFKGPSALNGEAAKGFMKSHEKALAFPFIGDSMYALDKNRYGKIGQAITGALKDKIMERKKDVKMTKAQLFVNKLPKEYEQSAYLELCIKLRQW